MKCLIALTCLLLFAPPAMAQEPELDQESAQHLEWLTKFVGNWSVEHEEVGSGTMKCTMLGKHWLINDLEMGGSGFSARGIQTIGYDPEKKKYVGTWVDSMTGYMWHYEGVVDDSGEKLVLDAEGPNMTDPSKTSKYRDAYEFKSPDHIVATSSMEEEDGTWTTIMTGNARRDKDDD